MERGILEEAVRVIERITDCLNSELTSLFVVGRRMSPEERIARSEHFLAVAGIVLRLEEKILSLREVVEDTEEKRVLYIHTLKKDVPSVSPTIAKKWRG